MQGCFAEPEWRHGGQPSFSPPLTAVSIPFYGLSSCKRRPFTVRKAVQPQCEKPSSTLQKTVFCITFRRFFSVFQLRFMHTFMAERRKVHYQRHLRLHTDNGHIFVRRRVFAERRPSHAPTEIKKKEFSSQELQGVNGSFSLRSTTRFVRHAHSGS